MQRFGHLGLIIRVPDQGVRIQQQAGGHYCGELWAQAASGSGASQSGY